jgi:hypothetical protein
MRNAEYLDYLAGRMEIGAVKRAWGYKARSANDPDFVHVIRADNSHVITMLSDPIEHITLGEGLFLSFILTWIEHNRDKYELKE